MQKTDNFNKALCAAVHTVAPGDTLYQIAQRYGTDYQRLMMLNGITNPYNIQPGDRICIPKDSIITETPEIPDNSLVPDRPVQNNRPDCFVPRPNPDNSQNHLYHIVNAGDTLYSISRGYGVPLSRLMEANPEVDPYNLLIGYRLFIPSHYPQPQPIQTGNENVVSENTLSHNNSSNNTESDTPVITNISSEIPDETEYLDHDNNQNNSNELYDSPNQNQSNNIESPTSNTSNTSNNSIMTYIADSSTDGIIYSIGPGDSLTSILAKFAVCVDALKKENPDIDFAGDLTGFTICIPYEDHYRRSADSRFCTVKPNDTLMMISARTGISADKLLLLNPTYNPEDFTITGNLVKLD